MDIPDAQKDKGGEDGSKKNSFEDLSKEELVKKCKGLLVIAQKAKQTKAELSKEIFSLKENYEKLELQKGADKESLKTMQEFVSSLTEQKLVMATEIDILKKQNGLLKTAIQSRETEIQVVLSSQKEKLDKLQFETSKKLSDMDIEVTSLKRQKIRLEKENEDLMQQMTEFENKLAILNNENIEQKHKIETLQDLVKDKETINIDVCEATVKLESNKSDMLDAVEDKLSNLENECENVKLQLQDKIEALKTAENNLIVKEQVINENIKNYECEKMKTEKLNLKLKQYRDKIIKCSSSITQLKNSKFVLLKTIKEYSESVPKWQRDILNASKLLSEQLLALEAENNSLKLKISSLEIATSQIPADQCVELTSQLENIRQENENLLLNIQSLESEKLILINEKKSAREIIHKNDMEKSELASTCQELTEKITSLNRDLSAMKDQLDSLQNEKTELETAKQTSTSAGNMTIKELKEEIGSLKLTLVALEEENKLLIESKDILQSKIDESITSSEEANSEIMEQNIMLQADISKLETKMIAYKTENASMLVELKENRQRLSELDSILKEMEEVKAQLLNYKSENMELLNEMKEINQVLKERGETISRQDMEISEANRTLQHLENELKHAHEEVQAKKAEIALMKDKILEKDSRLKLIDSANNANSVSLEALENLKMEHDNLKSLLAERDAIIISLNEDIDKIKKNQGNPYFDGQSENMSISTMSEMEESSRLKDLDKSYEERCSKYRMFIVKLKKRVDELNAKIKILEEEKGLWETEKAKITSGTVSKNMQTMQIEYDKVVDELEAKVAELKNKNKTCQDLNVEIINLNQVVMDAKEQYTQAMKEMELLKNEKHAIDNALKQCHSQIAAMKKDCETLKQREAEISQLKADITSLKENLMTETNAHQTTKEALEKTKRDVKKKSVLSLEMEDYERSMKDLTSKMEDNKKKMVQMESTIDTQEATIQSLRTQIKMLEDQIGSEERIVRETKELLQIATENLKEKESQINMKQDEIFKTEKKLEEALSKNEDINLQLASALGEKEKIALNLGQEKMDLTSRFKRCEQRCSELEELLKMRDLELDKLKNEFAGYKVRAQNVLRQNQTKDLSVEENLKEEMTALKAELESLNPELQSTKEELESVMSDRARLISRCSELQSTLQTERELANSQIQRDAHEYNTLKLQMSTLTQCYKKQISDLEDRTNEEISNLRKELEFSRISLERANALTKDQALALEKRGAPQYSAPFVSSIDYSNNKNTGVSLSGVNEAVTDVNVTLLEREEGEGSESTPSPSPTYMSRNESNMKQSNYSNSSGEKKRREPVPLEQLLEGDITEENYALEGDLETKLEVALRQIESQEKRLRHMTEIIAEAEKEVARRTQLGEALKEEVRRYERQLERTTHHHNQEYLKNVIIKFLTLNAGDERSRLVPVLHTILTLSPEETHQLTSAAKGVDPNTSKGWGSYIPWPGKS